MTVDLIKNENNKAEFKMEVSAERFEKAVNSAYLKNRGQIQIHGFRKGKAPRKVIEAAYGKDIFFEDAINEVLPEAYGEALKELELDPIDNPLVDIEGEVEAGKPVIFTAEVETRPIPELGDYSVLEVPERDYTVTDEEIDREVEAAREQNARIEVVEDRKSQDGDIVVIDFEGTIDGETFDGGSSSNYELELGSGSFIPGFEDQLIDHEAGDEVDVEVTFPEDYQAEDLKGKDAIFKTKIHSIKEKQLPDLDDEFAKDISEFDTLDEYKRDLREKREKEREEQKENDTKNAAVQKLVEISDFDVPQVMIDHQVDDDMNNFDQQLQQMGMNLDVYAKYMGKDSKDDLREQFEEGAENQVRAELVVDSLVEKEDIQVTEEEVDEELNRLADQYQVSEKEKFIDAMKESDELPFIERSVKRQKAVDFLVTKVKFVPAPEEKEDQEEKGDEDKEEKEGE